MNRRHITGRHWSSLCCHSFDFCFSSAHFLLSMRTSRRIVCMIFLASCSGLIAPPAAARDSSSSVNKQRMHKNCGSIARSNCLQLSRDLNESVSRRTVSAVGRASVVVVAADVEAPGVEAFLHQRSPLLNRRPRRLQHAPRKQQGQCVSLKVKS